MLQDSTSKLIAVGFTVATVIISVFQICQHLRNYTQPSFQRFIIRIIFLVPSYSVASCLALHYRHNSIYYETPRDCYEAWVIYNFMCLCMAYIGGPGAVVVKCEGKIIQPSWVLMTCCMDPIPVDGFFLRRCKQGTLQFVIAKPILAALTLILFITGDYHASNWAWDDGYPYITFIYNLCYAVALFWLLLLYVGTDELLKPYKPMLKFACFKAVIFLTFWQSLVISFLSSRVNIGYEDAEALQNWIIVVEMFFAAVGMVFAFPWSEYQVGGAAKGFTSEAFRHSLSISDVISDIMHQFNPSYGTYVLYHDGGPEKNVKKKKFMGMGGSKENKQDSTFSAATSAMTRTGGRRQRYNNRHIFDAEEADGDEEGALWYGGDTKPGLVGRVKNVFGMAGDRIQETGQQIISIIPIITEQERDQATLVDSDSDAEYDEENVRDNQVGMEALNSSDDDDDSDDHSYAHHTMTIKLSGGDDRNALPDSTSRVEAAFTDASGAFVKYEPNPRTEPESDSLARVELAFAEAFSSDSTSAVAVAPSAATEAPGGSGQVSTVSAAGIDTASGQPGAVVVPALPPAPNSAPIGDSAAVHQSPARPQEDAQQHADDSTAPVLPPQAVQQTHPGTETESDDGPAPDNATLLPPGGDAHQVDSESTAHHHHDSPGRE